MVMAHKLRVAFSIAALAAVAATGCGSQAAAGGPSHVISQADAVCKQVEARSAAINASLSKVRSQQMKEIAKVAPGFSQFELQAVERLRALAVPASLAGEWRELLAGMQQLAVDTARLGVAAGAGNSKGMEAINASGQPIRSRLEGIAQHVGFKYCGR